MDLQSIVAVSAAFDRHTYASFYGDSHEDKTAAAAKATEESQGDQAQRVQGAASTDAGTFPA